MTDPPLGLCDPLCPRSDDRRIVRLARRAIAQLLADKLVVTRSSLVKMSRRVDGKGKGFSDASLDRNLEVRSLYLAYRSHVPKIRKQGRGAISAQIRQLSHWQIAQKLVLARAASADRESVLQACKEQLGEPFDTAQLDQRRQDRAGLWANKTSLSPPTAATAYKDENAANSRARYEMAKETLQRAGNRLSLGAIANVSGLHERTIERIRRQEREEARAARSGAEPIIPSRKLLGLHKRDLARALHVERLYIREIDTCITQIAVRILARASLISTNS